MKKSTWRKHHKWFGLIRAFFIVMFSLSGLVLNHPSLFARFDVSRAILPSSYHYHNWNQGLIKGSIVWKKQVLLYGNNGIWLTNREASAFTAFNNGLPEGADNLQIRGLAVTRQGQLFALGQYALFQLHGNNTWHEVSLPNDEGDRLTDITVKADSLVITSRSNVYVSLPPYRH
ncbi:MAG: PepSY domain-containing protein, partial [Prevotellaceae bacterium]|nr:PepSY domain-containing protein [Prevotellaceae bacterium]